MPTFEIPTVPTNTQNDHAYNICREEARRSERCITKPRRGSMTYDREKGGMTLEWANEGEFRAWLAAEESGNTIELIVSQIERSDSPLWRERCVFRCSREFTGGNPGYVKKTQMERKIPSKKTGCRCHLTVKWYPRTETILGKYVDQHDHPLGDDNLRFIRLSRKIRDLIMDMVYIGINSKVIVSHNYIHHLPS